jgi:hypothetical protein
MKIEHNKEGMNGVFYIEDNGERLAEMTYYLKGENKMIIDHTEVDEKLRGKNIGLQLVETAVEFARSEQLKVVPACVFAKSVFEKNEELRDVLL